MDPPHNNAAAPRASLADLALLFLKLGLTAFGGPAAHIAMMQQEVVDRRAWISREEFLDLLGAANLIPGPSSTELAIFIGLRLGGPAGLVLAGVCFILPAFLLVLGIAWAYVQYGRLPAVGQVLYGVKPVVIAIVAHALWNLAWSAIKNRFLACLGLAALWPALLGVSPLYLLIGAGTLTGGIRWFRERETASLRPLVLLASVLALFALAPLVLRGPLTSSTHIGIAPLFWVFVKIGSVIYGSGYVLLAFLRTDLVIQRSWLSSSQLIDAVAVGQVTPGPVFTTATFIGFVLYGPAGAIAATLGIFLPAFLFCAFAGRFAGELRKQPLTGAFLDGVNVAAVALMVAVTWELARTALIDPVTVTLAAISLVVLIRTKVNATWLIAVGIVVGVAAGLLRSGLPHL